MKNRLPRSKILEIISNDLAKVLPIDESHLVEDVNPVDLISPERFDIMADHIYAKFDLLDVAKEWCRKVYTECKKTINSQNNYSSAPNLIAADQVEFDDFLHHIRDFGIDPQESYLPVSRDYVVIGNAHCLGASLVYNHPVKAIKFDYHPHVCDSQFLLKNGLGQDIADFMALTYCRLSQNMRVVVVFPIARGKDEQIEGVLSEYGRIAYEKQVSFTELGQYNLIQILYFNMHWIDPDGDITYGVRHHVDHRFWKDDSVKFYFFIFNDASKILEAKTRLRALFDLKNFPVHINDTHNETLWVSEHILTPNSIYFMNHAQPWLCKGFLRCLQAFHEAIDQQALDKDNFCLIGDSILAAYGLRDTRHIDMLYFGDETRLNFISDFRSVNQMISSEMKPVGDLIFDPSDYFYFRGLKFFSPSANSKAYLQLYSSKDEKDTRLIESIESESFDIHRAWRNIRFLYKKTLVKVTHIDLEKLGFIVPKFLRPIVKKCVTWLKIRGQDSDA